MDPTAGMPQSRLDELIASFREQGRRLTRQRLAVLGIPGTSTEHPSVQQIHEQMKLTFPIVSVATIYATIGLLEQTGEVMLWALANGGNRYDGRNPEPHPHLFCENCGPMVDLEIPSIDELPFDVAHKTGCRIVNHHLAFLACVPAVSKANSGSIPAFRKLAVGAEDRRSALVRVGMNCSRASRPKQVRRRQERHRSASRWRTGFTACWASWLGRTGDPSPISHACLTDEAVWLN